MFDSGALIAFERNDGPILRLIELAYSERRVLYIPSGVLAQVWRDGRQQARLARLLRSRIVDVQVLDTAEAQAVGVLCGKRRHADIVDASVIVLARRLAATIVTSDPVDLSRLDGTLLLMPC